MVGQHYCLRWNNYQTHITAEFETLRVGEHFVDVTLACDGRQLKAHKVVLSACSPYFKELFQGNPCSHPIVILKDVAYSHMRSLLEFMYAGEVTISEPHLSSFLHTAGSLKIRGLTESQDASGPIPDCLSPLTALKSLGPLGSAALSSLLQHPPLSHPLPPPEPPPPSPPRLLPSADPVHPFDGPPVPFDLRNHRDATTPSVSPVSLPPNKRQRTYAEIPRTGEAASQPNGNAMQCNAADAQHQGHDDLKLESAFKTEPLERPTSDTEGSGGGWADDPDGGGGSYRSSPERGPNAPPVNRPNPPPLPPPPDADAASHMIQALTPEGHLPAGLVRNIEPLPCPVCQRSYSSPGNLKQHLENIHMASNEPSYCCRICGNKFKSKWYLHKHLHRAHHIRGRKDI